MIKILFFAHLRDKAGVDAVEVAADDVRSVRELLPVLAKSMPPELLDALRDESAMVSVDQRYAGWDATLSDGAEVGFLPPVSGG